MITEMPKITKRLTALSTSEQHEPITPWVDSLEALSAVAVLITLAGKVGTFQCRIGVQTCNDPNSVNGIVAPAVPATADDQISALGSTLVRFDPNDASNGNIDGYKRFRLVVSFSSSGAVPAAGDVTLEASWR